VSMQACCCTLPRPNTPAAAITVGQSAALFITPAPGALVAVLGCSSHTLSALWTDSFWCVATVCCHCVLPLCRYVQCYDCGNPETMVKIKKEFIYLKCKACG
jgi:hypothetical protein